MYGTTASHNKHIAVQVSCLGGSSPVVSECGAPAQVSVEDVEGVKRAVTCALSCAGTGVKPKCVILGISIKTAGQEG